MCFLQNVGASVTSQEECIALYDVARPENMSPKRNTANTDDTPPPGYDVVCIENMQAEYENVPLVLAGKHTFTSENRPPLPSPMIRGDSEAPDLPPPYNPAVDSENVVVMSVESSMSQGVDNNSVSELLVESVENQSVDGEIDESVKRDLSVHSLDNNGLVLTNETAGSTEAQLNRREASQIEPTDDSGNEAKIAAQVRAISIQYTDQIKLMLSVIFSCVVYPLASSVPFCGYTLCLYVEVRDCRSVCMVTKSNV